MKKTTRRKYNKLNKKRIFILICLMMLVIFEIVAFRDSRASKIIDITASIIDSAENLETQQIALQATNTGKSGYAIVLPEYVDNKKIDSYIITEKNIHQIDEEIEKNESEESANENIGNSNNATQNVNENIGGSNNAIQSVVENTGNSSNSTENNVKDGETVQNSVSEGSADTKSASNEANEKTESLNNEGKEGSTSVQELSEEQSITVKAPGDTLYLSDEEVKNAQIELKVEYSTYVKNEQILYEQVIETSVDDDADGNADSNIKIEGFMPIGATIQATVVKIDEIENNLVDMLTDKISFKKAYDIKITYGDEEYEPTDFDTNVRVTISGIDAINENKQKYKVVHIDNTEQAKEIDGVKTTEDKIMFPADSFSTYALLLEDGISIASLYSSSMENASVWEGNVATEFRFGSGTNADPYLITNADELAYIAEQANNGTSYDGVYFELITDINLNNRVWTPIGDYNNPFKGIFDGNGYTIANATISLPTSLPTNVSSYGFFGSIGDSNSKTSIKNLQIDNIKIELNANGTTANNTTAKGYNIGIVAGTMYNNAEIKNVIVNNSSVTDNYTMTIRTNSTQIFVGGIVGLAVNSGNSTADPGDGKRYEIENCYSNTDIDLDMELYSNWRGTQYYVAGQYATGGIIGAIRSQGVWPENCLFKGSINATNGFTGPIFGYVRRNTGIGTQNNYETPFNTLWQGNDAGNLSMSSYYTGYSTNDRVFSNNEESGTSSSRITTNINWNFNIGYIQGVNKGLYTNDALNMLSNFNNYVTNNSSNGYLTWNYDSSTEAYYFKPKFTASVEKDSPRYIIHVNDTAQTGNYTYKWYIDGSLDSSITGDTLVLESNWTEGHSIEVLVSNGVSYAMVSFEVPKLEIHVSFEMNNQTNVLTAGLEGTGTADPNFNLNDYTYKWYKLDIAEAGEELEGETTNKITNLENGMQYKIVATNTKYPYMSAEGVYTYGTRTVIYCSYNNGNDNNDGFTPQTPVRTLSTAYSKFSNTTTRNENVIVLMGTYSNTSFFNTADSTTYRKNVTITGKYQGIDYNATLYFEANNTYKYLNGNTTFMHLNFDGSRSQTYFYLQGYSLTMGEGIVMQNYATSNTNQGLIEGNAPAFHIFAGWLQYDETRLPRTDAKIMIKSGTYGRILLGGSSGTSNVSSITKYNSHNFMGTSLTDDLYQSEITIDIKNSTTPSNYTYDINLLGGGSTCGNIYGDIKINIENGTVGRLLGANIGDSSYRPNNWNYPINTFIGTATINMTGGSVTEMYGGCLGRNMSAIGGGWNVSTIVCDSYFYGTVNLNISGGTITKTIYGAGAGGVSGYSENSTDNYKSYGADIDTVVNINISGGTINADIYGGGYGYTEYLTANTTQTDGGTLYGSSNINISGSPTINGNIYGAGRGYNLATNKPDLAQMEGSSTITITETPTITGNIYGAGMGLSQYAEMAKLTGTATVNVNANLSTNVFGGGNISKTVGNTFININDGTHTGDIYGGGNVGILEGTANVTINGGTSNDVYGGGKSADVTNSNVYIKGGQTANVYGGGNQAGAEATNIKITGGNTTTVYGGSNQSGTVNKTTINGLGGTCTDIYGGNNEGGTCPETNVTIDGTNVTDAVYGGGNQVATVNTNVILNSSGNEIPYIFGGGKSADATTTNVTTKGGKAINVFGGSNTNGTVTTSNVTIEGGNLQNVFGGNNAGGQNITGNVNINGGTVKEVFGGNNLGGTNTTSNVVINNGLVTDVYGGGNQAVTHAPNVTINDNSNIDGSVYGGGNQAGIETDTNVEILGGTISGNVYGGGNEGTVTGNTYVHVKDATLNSSLYAGGNGTTAIVFGNANVTVEGNTNIAESVFGGGNQAETGTQENNNSLSTVNIVGGNIGKNVYGGANTSVVYGNTLTNIGYDAVGDSNLTIGDIIIGGTVFGGGEANASGSEIYDFSFISVTVGIDININGTGHDKCQIKGSIFGSGNASSTIGYSNINIKNYGSVYSPQKNVSIQRADIVVIDNSAIALSGAKDRTNEYSNVDFTVSRVDELKLKNNSIIYLNCGANLLKKFTSCVDENGTEVKATATINEETGETTRNVDNRIYMLEGKNLNIATNEQVTAFGEVSGMTFFGLFTNEMNPATSTGLYNREYNNGDVITNAGTFSSNSYVRGLHKTDHDTTVDGFYTNYDEEENKGYIRTRYIETTPKDDVYYIWLVGIDMDVTTFEVTLTASKYATLGTYELGLTGFSEPNIKFSLFGFSAGLAEGISLVEPNTIESVELDEAKANSIFGLTMKTGNNGWQSNSSTTFLTANGGTYTGSTTYNGDNSSFTPALNLCLYHSQNISLAQKLGNVRIRLQVQIPEDDLNVRIAYIDIIITMNSALYQNDFYEAAIAPGEEFGLFTTTETNITDSSVFSTYYSLYIPDFSESDYYEDYTTYKHVLVSRLETGVEYAFTANTKITMIDMVTNKYYYYVVTQEDEASGKYVYNLSDFVVMGSDSTYYDEVGACNEYYNQEQNLIYENFIFHIDFGENEIPANLIRNSLLMELRDSGNQTMLGVLGIQRDAMVYSVYKNKDAKINVTTSTNKDTVYLGDKFTLTVETKFTQDVVDSKTVYDTQFFDDKMGIKISIYDSNGNRLNSDSLLGVSFELDGIKYYPRIDGTVRINTAEKVSNVLSRVIIDTENNTVIATGEYTIKVESFGSPDGIYYGIEPSDTAEVKINIVESTYGLKVYTSDEEKMVEKATGQNQKGNNDIDVNIEYSSGLENPNLTISLYRRDYSSIYSQVYTLVDIGEYLTVAPTDTKKEKEYVVSRNPSANMKYSLDLATDLVTGTYKIVVKLYDGDEYIGEAYEYLIIK